MTLRLTTLTAALLFVAAYILPASSTEKYTPLPPALDGSMMPYDFASCTQIPYLPDSLTPVYAAYVARHGARYLSSPKKMVSVMKALEKGRNSGTLSDTGEDFLTLMNVIRTANEGNWGDLTPTGIREERLLGRRMAETLPALGQHGTRVEAISSYVPRAVMTMYQFSNELIRLNDRISVDTDEGPEFSPLVCCFSADSAYAAYRRDGDWKAVYDDFVARKVPSAPARRLFTSTSLSDHDLRKLTLDMYEVLKANRAAGLPAPSTRWMSVGEYTRCWEASNLQHYLRNSVTPLSTVAARATSPLLLRVISDTDKALASGDTGLALNGYFGHAETLLPLLSLIKIPGCFDMPLDYDSLDSCWKIQNITPLGANLLILIARSPGGGYYAAVQLNGRTVKPMKGYPDIVRWQDLRQYWLDLVAAYAAAA